MRVLITGGAGFIGSNLVEKLMNDDTFNLIRVVDDLSNGSVENISNYLNHPKFEFVVGSITDFEICLKVTKDIDVISHQAAIGSIPRSIENPTLVCQTNIMGSINLLFAASLNKVNRFVFASSSSIYGDDKSTVKLENRIGSQFNPYAASKATLENFAHVFNVSYKMDFIGLRYFNVFGPKQKMDSPYSAVIPNFCRSFINCEPPIIYGDGETKRDFTFVGNVVDANYISMVSNDRSILNNFYNIGCGSSITLNDVIKHLNQISGISLIPIYHKERPNDVKHSQANINFAESVLGYHPSVNFSQGLEITFKWYKALINKQ